MNDDERDALLEELRPERRSIAQRVFTPQRKIKAGVFVAACVAGGLALDRFGVDGQPVIRGMFLASPVMAAAVLAFLRHAWGQNYIPSLATGLATAEPADLTDDLTDGLASEPGHRLARPASQPTVPVAVRSLPASQPTIPFAVAKAGEPAYTPWEDPDGDD